MCTCDHGVCMCVCDHAVCDHAVRMCDHGVCMCDHAVCVCSRRVCVGGAVCGAAAVLLAAERRGDQPAGDRGASAPAPPMPPCTLLPADAVLEL